MQDLVLVDKDILLERLSCSVHHGAWWKVSERKVGVLARLASEQLVMVPWDSMRLLPGFARLRIALCSPRPLDWTHGHPKAVHTNRFEVP